MPQNLPIPCKLHNQRIYRNLHKGCWSVKSEQTNPASTFGNTVPTVKGRVTGHAHFILAYGATPKISEAGRQRVIREGRKNVHAYLSCDIVRNVRFYTVRVSDTTPRCSYNPYNGPTFYDRNNRHNLTHLPVAYFDRSGCVFYSDYIIRAGENHFLDRDTFEAWAFRNGYDGPVDTTYCNGVAALSA